MFRYIVILAILPALIMGQDNRITYEACKDGGPLPDWVEIEGCSLTHCDISASNPLSVRAQLVARNNASGLTVSLRGYLLGIIGMDLTLPEEIQDGCNIINCPVTEGEVVDVTVETALEMTEIAIGADVTIELLVVNEESTRVMCVRTNVSIVA